MSGEIRNELVQGGRVVAVEVVDPKAGTVATTTGGTTTSRPMTADEVRRYALRDRTVPYVFESRGDADCSAALQAVIDDCLGRVDPTSGARTARYPIVLAPGRHTLALGARVESALGFTLTGSGMGQTEVRLTGTGHTAAIDLNGVSRSNVGGFTLSGAAGASTDKGIWLRWGSGIVRSSNYDVLRDIAVENLKFVEGIRLGEEGANNQVDTAKLYNVHVKGQWTAAESTWWRAALAVGHNVFANNLNHTGYGCSFAFCARGIDMRRSQFALYGGEFGENGADLYLTAHTMYLKVSGIRSEGSQRLLDGTGITAAGMVTIEDYDWRGNHLAADERFVRMFSGGTLSLRNVRVSSLADANVRPKIHLRPEKPLHLILDGFECRTPMASWLDIDQALAPVTITGQGWCETNSSGQPDRRAALVLSKSGAPYELSIGDGGAVVATAIT